MSKIEPTYVTFEQAKLLKEKGFNEECETSYYTHYEKLMIENNGATKITPMHNYSRPEQWQVVEWLRVNHGIWICVNKSKDAEDNGWFHYYVDNKWSAKLYDTPQEAYSAAFDYILNNLI
jgi:hypothetical protein